MGKVIIVQINKQQLVAFNKFLGEWDVWMNRIYVDIRIKDYDIMQDMRLYNWQKLNSIYLYSDKTHHLFNSL